jgi:Citrate transporter
VTTSSASIPLVSTIFALTYGALALGKVPGLRIDRAGIALIGAAAMLATGVLSMRDAAKAVDYETIVLLFGMMVVVSYLRLAGFFAVATERIVARFSGPLSLLAVIITLSGVLSAFLVNDVVCVALTPLVLHLCRRLKRPPIPYLVGLASTWRWPRASAWSSSRSFILVHDTIGVGRAAHATRPRRVGPSGADRSRSLVPPGTGPPVDRPSDCNYALALVTGGRMPWRRLPTGRRYRSTSCPQQPGRQPSCSCWTRHNRQSCSRHHSKRHPSSRRHNSSTPPSWRLSFSRRRHRPSR